MKRNFFFKAIIPAAFLSLLTVSCDKDFNTIDSDLDVDNDHFGILLDTLSRVVAYNQPTGPVQTTNLAVNQLGIYNNKAFGKTKASFVTQLAYSTTTAIGDNPVVDSVALYVPYFSTKTSDLDGNSTYALDSIYGGADFKLSIYESGYFLNDFSTTPPYLAARYYSDQQGVFENLKIGAAADGTPVLNGERLNNATGKPWQNDNFHFSAKEISLITPPETEDDEADTTLVAPGMRINLNQNYFQKKILEAPAGKLSNQGVFKDYMRGLYFKAEENTAGKNAMGMLDFSKGSITIYFKQDFLNTTTNLTTRVKKTYVINLTGTTVNLLETTKTNPAYIAATAAGAPDRVNGDKELYLKGGDGSIALIDLFTPEQLEKMRSENWMINEANLVFYVDQQAVAGSPESKRVFLYDATNHKVLRDYSLDITTSTNIKNNKVTFGGILETDDSANNRPGVKYKIRLTNHIRNLVRKDSTNVQLGLVVTESINVPEIDKFLENPVTEPKVTRVPKGSVMHPFGTILYGSRPDVAEPKKRLKLEIYYTKPE